MVLHQIALAEIRRVTQEAKQHADEFLQRAIDKHQCQLKKELSSKTREFEKATRRLTDLDKLLNANRFLKIVEKYIDIGEIIPELVREFIDKIVVHERSEPWKKKNYTQQVDVYFNFVGKV